MLNTAPHFTGTYLKNLLADWSVITTIIQQRTIWVRDTINSDAEKTPLLSDLQINDAFNGPFKAFLKHHLSAYAAITKVETALTITKDDTFKEAEHIANPTLGVPTKLLDKTDFSTLKSLRDELNTLTQTHYAQWETQLQTWEKTLIDALATNNIKLTDMELQEFSINQPISELEDRIINLKVAIPKLSKSDFDFQQYWMLKTMLAIQSALSRVQLPHTEKDIEHQLKSLKPLFNAIVDSEGVLRGTQEQAVLKLIRPITFSTEP